MTRTSPVLVSVALAITSVLAIAAPAAADAALASSTPVAGATLTALPDAFSVTMNEDLLDLEGEGSGFGLLVRDAAGLYYGDGCVAVDGPTMSAEPVIGEPGEYTMIWQVVSGDGHATSDKFTFTWAPEGGFETTEGSTKPGDCNGLYVRDGAVGQPDDESDGGDLRGLIVAGVVIVSAAIVAAILLLRRRRPVDTAP